MIKNKEYLTLSSVQKIINIKASFNLGLSDELKEVFPNLIPILKPVVKYKKIPDHNWLAGFVNGEGCFL